jgi:hypothetical protein
MSTEEVVGNASIESQYVCFIKKRTGSNFVAMTSSSESDSFAVKSLREFLDYSISRWLKSGEEDKVLLKVSLEQFKCDVATSGMNSKLRELLGWNYPSAARLAESDGMVFILVYHPRYEARAYSFVRVRDDDIYALELLRDLWSLVGGEIAFEEYDPAKHVAGYQYGG